MKTEIKLSGECGNSPKNAFTESFSVALMTADLEALTERLTDDCLVLLPEAEPISGRDQSLLAIAKTVKVPESLKIDHAIAHGRVGACNGSVAFSAGRKDFAVMLEFKNTKADSVSAIRLYFR